MRIIERIDINGAFVTPHGEEFFDLFNPATGKLIGRVRLGDVEDTRHAIAEAKGAFQPFPAQFHLRCVSAPEIRPVTRVLPR
jgi:aldehyde dehydrogenase (NAD+)